ncbi:unnamed protein product [Pipistrellus nathusii]|uniref:Uncharacterized protein n=1 Tax=Pipistrellus nathusii TaxID=59473 RepID=A0ABN9ZNJ0_PIPNA
MSENKSEMCVQQSAQRGLFGVFPSTQSPESQRSRGLEGRGPPPPGKGKDSVGVWPAVGKVGKGLTAGQPLKAGGGSGPLTCEDLLQQKKQKIAICPLLQ